MERNKNLKKKQQSLKKHENSKNSAEKNDNNDSGHGGSEVAFSASLAAIQAMTSRDFHFDHSAHIEMISQLLKDTVRINTFKAAILHNKHLFKGKCVLNIGCGTGIYAMFAAKAGAAKVFAVDSSNVVHYTREIVQANGYAKVIEVMKGNIKEIELPVPEVDIIVADWMGYALLFQSTCDNVIFARDKWLKKKGGFIFPDQGKLYMVALEDTKHKNGNIDWWSNVYGFNMRCLRDAALLEPRYQSIRPEQIISKQFPVKILNLNTATLDDLNFRSKFMLPIEKSGPMDAIALYFHVYFTKSHTPLGFSTDPWSPRTNWLQTILFFDQTLSVNAGSLYYGGIEFISPTKNVNLNNIIVNLEMLMGDPAQVDVEVELSWHFKLNTSSEATENLNNSTEDLQNILKNNKINEGKTLKETETKLIKEIKPVTKKSTVKKNTITCSGLVLTTDNTNGTITIGKQNYPLKKNKKSKCKFAKKVLNN